MLSVVSALLPVFLIILLGAGLRHSRIFDQPAWRGFENLCYFVLFPILLVKTLATARIGGAEVLLFALSLLFAIFAMTGLLLLLWPLLGQRFGVTPAAFTSLVQGTTRWHGFVALSMVGLLYGDEGVTFMAITMAVIIPPLNIINVSVLARFGSARSDLRGVLGKLIRNPFIIACAAGAALNLSGIGLSGPLYHVFDILGGGALGLGLLTVGAGLHVGHVLGNRALVAFGALLRLLGMPALMFLGCLLFGIDGLPRTVAVLAGAVPTASSSYILARQMGGDHQLMANLISVQVLLAAATLPLMIWLAQG
ncbi:MAG TPA: AEC family transporter [Sedimenticola thiotaurini]|uniref:AEC family transporter n=2 Tax=Sedimenticola thiotaurini TaxID=1543721 RepID=A0A831W947_9GAMM|nr:AEC family transporter [Sedimenticola thiotaurini]